MKLKEFVPLGVGGGRARVPRAPLRSATANYNKF